MLCEPWPHSCGAQWDQVLGIDTLAVEKHNMIHEGGACGVDIRPLRHTNFNRGLARCARCNRATGKLRKECRCRRAKPDLSTVADDQSVGTIQGDVAGVV